MHVALVFLEVGRGLTADILTSTKGRHIAGSHAAPSKVLRYKAELPPVGIAPPSTEPSRLVTVEHRDHLNTLGRFAQYWDHGPKRALYW